MGNEASQAQPKSKAAVAASKPGTSGLSKVRGNPTKSQSLSLHVKQASMTGIFTFKEYNLSHVPIEILSLTNLRTVDLSRNKIGVIPPEIAAFQSLRALTLHTNQIEFLPEDIGLLKKLEILNVSANRLATLPETFLSLKSLKSLDLSGNDFPDFPSSITFLPNIAIIDFSNNHITQLPVCIANLNAHELNISSNQIVSLPSELAHCRYLKVLKAEKNQISLESLATEILTESKISLLKLEGNLFSGSDFQNVKGYDKYEERYAAVKSKVI